MKGPWCFVSAKERAFVCSRCGVRRPDGLPCALEAWIEKARAFQAEHQHCEPALAVSA